MFFIKSLNDDLPSVPEELNSFVILFFKFKKLATTNLSIAVSLNDLYK